MQKPVRIWSTTPNGNLIMSNPLKCYIKKDSSDNRNYLESAHIIGYDGSEYVDVVLNNYELISMKVSQCFRNRKKVRFCHETILRKFPRGAPFSDAIQAMAKQIADDIDGEVLETLLETSQ